MGSGRGEEYDFCKNYRDAFARYREAVDAPCFAAKDKGHSLRFALEPQPHEPRGDTLLSTVRHAMVSIETLDQPEMLG